MGKRILTEKMLRAARSVVADRSAVVYSVDTLNRYAYVIIQGSTKQIKAFFPTGWTSCPYWLKPGQAIVISHPGGVRGRIELVGPGCFAPSGVVLPSQTPGYNGYDGVVSGYGAWATTDGSQKIIVGIHSYRISNTIYTLPVIAFGDANFAYDIGIRFDYTNCVLSVSGAPSPGFFRYDLVVAGTDQVAHIVEGTASMNPQLPDVPSNHIKLVALLVQNYNGAFKMTVIGA